VAPSGSCVHHVRDNFDAIEQTTEVKEVRARTYEIVEFLHDILKVDAFPWARFPHRVGLHNSCGTLRRLKHATPSELHEPFYSKPMDLLSESAALSPPLPRRDQSACLGGDDHAPSPPRHSKEDEGRDGKRQMCAAGGIVGVGLQRCSSRTDLLCKGSTGARGSWTIGGASQCFLAHLSRRDSEGVRGSWWGPQGDDGHSPAPRPVLYAPRLRGLMEEDGAWRGCRCAAAHRPRTPAASLRPTAHAGVCCASGHR